MKKSYITPKLIARDIKLSTILAGTQGPETGEGNPGDNADSKFVEFSFSENE